MATRIMTDHIRDFTDDSGARDVAEFSLPSESPANEVTRSSLVPTPDYVISLPSYQNLVSPVYAVTRDKLELALNRHLDTLEARRAWIAPLGLLIAFLGVFVSADFHGFVVSKETWQAIWTISTLAASVWLVKTTIEAVRARGKNPTQAILDELRGNAEVKR